MLKSPRMCLVLWRSLWLDNNLQECAWLFGRLSKHKSHHLRRSWIDALLLCMVFPRDGTSCCPFDQGWKYFLVPWPFVLGQGQEKNSGTQSLSPPKKPKNRVRSSKTRKYVLRQDIPVPHPVPDFDRLSCGKIWSLSRCPFSWDNEGTSVPLSQKVALFRPIAQWLATVLWRHFWFPVALGIYSICLYSPKLFVDFKFCAKKAISGIYGLENSLKFLKKAKNF